MPPVYNYHSFEYKGGSENWGLALNNSHELFVANSKGLLHFDGERWSLNKLPNNTIIRSVHYSNNKVYSGSYEEFGFWEKDKYGVLKYTSLTNLIKDHRFSSEEFWEILSFKDAIIFKSFTAIYIYKNNKISVVKCDPTVSDMILFKDKIIVGGGNKGLFQLSENKLMPLKNQNLLIGKTIVDMEVIEDKLLIGTKLHGCFVMHENDLNPWKSILNEELKIQQINKILNYKNNKIIFGTIKNGVYLYDNKRKEALNINKQSGLQNNTVLSMLINNDQLWLGLDHGVDRIKLNNHISYYTDHSGTLGTVYDIALYQDKLYLGCNTGVYFFDNDELKFVNGTQGHVWDLEVIEDDLICGHNTGTYKIHNNNLEQISNIAGGYRIIKVPEKKSTFIQGTYSGLARYIKNSNSQWRVEKIKGIDFPVNQLCFESSNYIWAAHPYKGIYKIGLDFDKLEVLNIKEFEDTNIPSQYNVNLYKIKNQIILNSAYNWYKYEPIMDSIVDFNEFKTLKNKDLLYYNNESFWLTDEDDGKEILYTNLKNDVLIISGPQFKKRFVPESRKVVSLNDSIYYITLYNGFGKINLSKLRRSSEFDILPIPNLSLFTDEKAHHPLENNHFNILYKHSKNITINVNNPNLIDTRYFYQLNGKTNLQGHIEKGVIEFQNLPFGDYTLKVSSVGVGNNLSLPKTLTFTVSLPWYFSWPSIFLYFILALFIVYIVRATNKRKLLKKQKQYERKVEVQNKAKLAALEKEKMTKEIKSKQSELVRTTMDIAKKNELILEIKRMLLLDKNNFSNKKRYNSFLKKLDKSIKSDDDWKHFQMNFRELHSDFFERLLSVYPDLTPKDLRLCAYLKMNLSSKEIAPLMAISHRGVEIHRYRLRKKLELVTSENLSNFLITFS